MEKIGTWSDSVNPFNRNVIFVLCLDKVTTLRLSSNIGSSQKQRSWSSPETQRVVKPSTLLQPASTLFPPCFHPASTLLQTSNLDRSLLSLILLVSVQPSKLDTRFHTVFFDHMLASQKWSDETICHFMCFPFWMGGRRVAWQRAVCRWRPAGLKSFLPEELLLTGTFPDFDFWILYWKTFSEASFQLELLPTRCSWHAPGVSNRKVSQILNSPILNLQSSNEQLGPRYWGSSQAQLTNPSVQRYRFHFTQSMCEKENWMHKNLYI